MCKRDIFGLLEWPLKIYDAQHKWTTVKYGLDEAKRNSVSINLKVAEFF